METFNSYSKCMRELMDYCIVNASEFVEDMMEDAGEWEETTLKQYRESVAHQAIFFLQTELDAEYADTPIPMKLQEALKERVKNIDFKVVV